MGFRCDSKSALTITITAEVALRELLEEGPDAFAKRARELPEAELEPLLQLDWKKLRRPGHPARPVVRTSRNMGEMLVLFGMAQNV